MPDPSQRGPSQVLHAPGGRLGALLAHARRLAALEAALAPCLDPELAPHCRVAAWAGGRLVLAADTSAWATRLRYHSAEIRQKLSAAGHEVTDCRVIVSPPPAAPAAAVRDAPRLGAAAAAALDGAAGCVGDAGLAEALKRLARNASR